MAKSKGSKWGKKLKSINSGWQKSESRYKEIFGGRDIPDDVYLAKLQDIGLAEVGDKPVIKREHLVIEGEHKGTVLKDNMFLSSDTGCAFARRYLKMTGVEIPENSEDLEDTLVELKELAPICKVRSKTDNNGYKNIDVISVVDDDDDDEAEEVNLDEMDKKELRAFVKDNDIEIEDYRKLSEDDLRAAIAEILEGDDDGDEGDDDGDDNDDDSDSDDGSDSDSDSDSDDDDDDDSDDDDDDGDDGDEAEEVDFDEMDVKEMKAFVKENDIDPVEDLGYKTKAKFNKATEEDLREKLEEYVENAEDGDSSSEEDDELLEEAKVFCGSWDIEIDDDADLDDIKDAIEKKGKVKPFPEKELDEDEMEVLEKLELTKYVKAKKATAKKGGKKK